MLGKNVEIAIEQYYSLEGVCRINSIPSPVAQLVECPLRGTGGNGFVPWTRHTKIVKSGTSCSSFCIILTG